MNRALLAVVIIGPVAVLVLPDLLHDMGRSKQNRTLVNVHDIAMAWETRANDFNTFAVDARAASGMAGVRYSDLKRALVPKYIKQLPHEDGWGHPLQFAANRDHYFIRSTGRDAHVDHFKGVTTSFDNDIVFGDGTYIEYPEGL